jgi:hypothetical protein
VAVRLTSAIWVSAYLRRSHGAGAYAVVRRRGAAEAGAIFVVLDRLDGTRTLFAPAPQSLVDADDPRDRLFTEVTGLGDAPDAIERRLEREARFDSDLWVVEIEDREGRHFLDLAS